MDLRTARRIASGRVTLSDLQAEAERLLQARRSRSRRPAKPGTGATRKERARAKREERADALALACAVVLGRSGGLCEWCRPWVKRPATEFHHVLSGPLRRLHEKPDTIAHVCGDCHRLAHRNDRFALEAMALRWALNHGFGEARAAIDRRIAKLDEARRPSAPSPDAAKENA